eukprot:7377694-Prymnesium_polylepis.1
MSVLPTLAPPGFATKRASNATAAVLGGAHVRASTPKHMPRCPSSASEPGTPGSSSRAIQYRPHSAPIVLRYSAVDVRPELVVVAESAASEMEE